MNWGQRIDNTYKNTHKIYVIVDQMCTICIDTFKLNYKKMYKVPALTELSMYPFWELYCPMSSVFALTIAYCPLF